MIEIALALVIAATGLGLLAPITGRLPWPAVAALAVPVGGAVHMTVAAALLAVTGTVDPGAALVGDAVVGAAGLAVAIARRRVGLDLARAAGVAIAVTAAVVWLVWTVHLARLTPDSLRYLLGAADIQVPGAAAAIHPADLMKRQFGLQALHALSAFTDRAYVAFVAPLFGVFGTMFFGWLLWTRMAGTRAQRTLVLAATVVFVLGSNRFLYNFFYINGHMQTAVFMLIAIAGMWLAVVDDEPSWGLPAGLALGATLLLRPEAPIVAVLVLVPLAASRAGWTMRVLMTVPSAVSLVFWYGMVLWEHALGSRASLSDPVTGNIVAVLVSIAAVFVAGTGRWPRLIDWGVRAVVPAFAGALAAYALIDPSTLVDSVAATATNLIGYGLWIIAWPVTLLLLAVALLTHRVPESRLWTTPIMGFAFLFFLLPYIRESPWRVGSGDSGSRILTHMFLVVLAFVVIAFAGDDEGAEEE
jgi:hypothetical protein